MKKLSKVLSVICALVLVASLGVTAFASGSVANTDGVNIESVTPEENTIAPLTVELQATLEKPTPKYSVNVAWESLVFEYGGTTAPTGWNPATHRYDTPAGAGRWSNNSAKITITNNSNVDVTAETTYESTDYTSGNANENGITITVSGDSYGTPAQLVAGNESNKPVGNGTENQAVVNVAVSGTPTKDVQVDAGTITVAISAASEAA